MTWFGQLAPSRLGLAMLVVVLVVFGSLMGATFASAQAHAVHRRDVSVNPTRVG